MLKNKKVLYLLIPLNIFIWGFFIYRFYKAFNDSDLPLPEKPIGMMKLEMKEDTVSYKLSLNYSDPFLKNTPRHKNVTITENHTTNTNPAPIKIPATKTNTLQIAKAPDIKYLGLIKSHSTGISRALVSLNGQSLVVKKGEISEGVTFKNFDKDSLVIKWAKEMIVIRK